MKKPFLNLDALVAESVRFQFKGNAYTIKPLTIEAFMRFNNAWFELQQTVKNGTVSNESAMDLGVGIIKSVCDDLPEEKIRNEMSIVQIGALVQLVVDTVMARDTDEAEIKKKVLKLRETVRLPISNLSTS